jgi:hypothetical protein|tara:strand:+ start:3759 stop:4109 length:351 start_codon:yes stop_codon:yes gene_type:complete
MAKKKAKKTTKAKKTPKMVAFKKGQKVKRIDIFRLFDDSQTAWKRWNAEKGDWNRVAFKTEVKDLDFKITKVQQLEADYVMYWAESKNWRIRWVKKPKDTGWGFLSVLRQDLLKDK